MVRRFFRLYKPELFFFGYHDYWVKIRHLLHFQHKDHGTTPSPACLLEHRDRGDHTCKSIVREEKKKKRECVVPCELNESRWFSNFFHFHSVVCVRTSVVEIKISTCVDCQRISRVLVRVSHRAATSLPLPALTRMYACITLRHIPIKLKSTQCMIPHSSDTHEISFRRLSTFSVLGSSGTAWVRHSEFSTPASNLFSITIIYTSMQEEAVRESFCWHTLSELCGALISLLLPAAQRCR